MSGPTQSYLRVHYELRPAKQVERHMLVDALHHLAASGFPIREYQYTGMGSVYFVDFMLFHRALGLQRMLSVEHDPNARRRVEFNKPYEFVQTHIGEVGGVIPDLDPTARHILWLDYDSILQASHLQDSALATAHLLPGSIVLVTVDTGPPGEGVSLTGAASSNGAREWRDYYVSVAGQYLGADPPLGEFAREKLPAANARALLGALRDGLVGRPGLRFMQLFCFQYADGARMLSVGGMVVSTAEERRVRGSALMAAPYVRTDLRDGPYEIRVPRITRKERIYLDSHMPCPDDWRPRAFELKKEDAQAYREVYRFYPNYAELLL